ncbi:PAS domain-containing protein [Sphingomicrobium nitratireducens]|uniref:PAS domain-containing protein n=1 Tax=Sphingomicrobium nitratireducens TaxID=2964666 RepID=UPI00223FDC60
MNAVPAGVAQYLGTANLALSLSPVDSPDAELLQVNDRFCALTGYAEADVLGRNCRFLQRHLTHQPGVAPLREFMADRNRRRVRTHLINFRADGTPFINQLTLHRLTGPGGTPRLILASQFDVSAAAPSELLDYNAELTEQLRPQMRGRDEREMYLGSIQSIAEAAAAISQARFLMDEADRAGILGIHHP